MSRKEKVKTARKLQALAEDQSTTDEERASVAERVKQFRKKYRITDAEMKHDDVLTGTVQVAQVDTDPKREPNKMMLFLAIIIELEGGYLFRRGVRVFLSATASDLDRLKDLAIRLLEIYVKEGLLRDNAIPDWERLAAACQAHGLPVASMRPCKISFWAGMTHGLVNRITQHQAQQAEAARAAQARTNQALMKKWGRTPDQGGPPLPMTEAAAAAPSCALVPRTALEPAPAPEAPRSRIYPAKENPPPGASEIPEQPAPGTYWIEVKNQRDFLAGQRAAARFRLWDKPRVLLEFHGLDRFKRDMDHLVEALVWSSVGPRRVDVPANVRKALTAFGAGDLPLSLLEKEALEKID